ncbi:hypothetical protein [Humidesulfovibrio sp.]
MAHCSPPAVELSALHAHRHLMDGLAALRQALQSLPLDGNAAMQRSRAARPSATAQRRSDMRLGASPRLDEVLIGLATCG